MPKRSTVFTGAVEKEIADWIFAFFEGPSAKPE